MRIVAAIIFLFISFQSFAQKDFYLITGSYTRGKSTGMHVYEFDQKTGAAKLVDSISTPNPSYLAVAPDQKFVYAVSETVRGNHSGRVRAFSFDNKTGKLTYINDQLSAGDNPCYVMVDKTGKWIAVANYTSGTLAVLPIHKDGSLGAAVDSFQHYGHGVNAQRQEAPHVHSVVFSPDNKFLFVQDLGIDKIMIYSFNQKNGNLSLASDSAVKLQDGSGPRHFDFHPNKRWAYLVQEMGGTVTAFNYADGHLKAFQTITTLPPGMHFEFSSADIHVSPDGKFLYASNRDLSNGKELLNNSIAIYKINQNTGELTAVGHQSTLGNTPRNFNFDPSGDFLLVANQNSDSIVIFKIDHATGLLEDTGNRIDAGNPVCIKWVKRK
jgi:6-phosphogluconolactonase